MSEVALTTDIKSYLAQEVMDSYPVVAKVAGTVSSIYTVASEEGLSVQDWVTRDPDHAMKVAEANLAEWDKILNVAALEGALDINNRVISLNKNITKMIESRLDRAQEDVKTVQKYIRSIKTLGTKRKDTLINALYHRAVEGGDTRALLYMIDRVEGRPGEAKVVAPDYDNMFNVYKIIHGCFDKQLAVLNSGPGTKLVMTSRRAGKTRLVAATMLIECLSKPNTVCMYIGPTLKHSELLLNTAMGEIIEEAELKDAKGNRLNWKKFDNGSKIYVRGLSNTNDPDQIRGIKSRVIALDEFFHLKSDLLEYMIKDVLEPMQMDYASSYKMICVGTPAPIKGTFGDFAWDNWDVAKFRWNAYDNPFPEGEDKKAYIEGKLREKGLDWDSSYARREYLGERTYDEDLLLYPEVHCYNSLEGTPRINVDKIVVGIDYGVSDSDAIIAVAWDCSQRRGYVFFEKKFNRLTIGQNKTQLSVLKDEAKACWELSLSYFPDLLPKEANKRITWNADDSHQHLSHEIAMNVRCNTDPELRIYISTPHKTDQVLMFDKMRDLFRTADLLLPEGSLVLKETQQTVLKRGPNGEVYPEVDHRIYHPDLLPALRYAMWDLVGIEVTHGL